MTIKTAKEFIAWAKEQIRELEGYVNVGDNDRLREMCLHAIRWLIAKCNKLCRRFRIFTNIEKLAY